ncbi:MAG: condensation domain-containing protein [Limnobacter sp.]|nr:condensation domain-containing protein [Limnobacter sp.]
MLKTPLNLLDAAFLNLDTRENPWSVHVEVRVEGKFEAEKLVKAIHAAALAHPIARARMAEHTAVATVYEWHIPNEPEHLALNVVTAKNLAEVEAARARLQSILVPLSVSPSFLCTLVHHSGGDYFMLNVSHSSGDGMSTFRLMQSIMRHYAKQADPVAVDALTVRDLKALAGSQSLTERIERTKIFLDYLWRAVTPPVRLASKKGRSTGDESVYGFKLLAFNPKETAKVMTKRVKPATVNDLLLAGLAHTVKEWNSLHAGKQGRISVMMPVNLRPAEWWHDTFGNYSSYVSVSLTQDEQSSLSESVQAISRQTAILKEKGGASVLIDLLDIPKWLPAALKSRLRDIFPVASHNLVESTLLSNLGRLAEFPTVGSAGAVKELYFSPPAIMPLGVSVGAASVADEMFLTVRYHRDQFDEGAAGEFADLYRKILTD